MLDCLKSLEFSNDKYTYLVADLPALVNFREKLDLKLGRG